MLKNVKDVVIGILGRSRIVYKVWYCVITSKED